MSVLSNEIKEKGELKEEAYVLGKRSIGIVSSVGRRFGGIQVQAQLEMVGLLLNRDHTVTGIGLVRSSNTIMLMLIVVLIRQVVVGVTA